MKLFELWNQYFYTLELFVQTQEISGKIMILHHTLHFTVVDFALQLQAEKHLWNHLGNHRQHITFNHLSIHCIFDIWSSIVKLCKQIFIVYSIISYVLLYAYLRANDINRSILFSPNLFNINHTDLIHMRIRNFLECLCRSSLYKQIFRLIIESYSKSF